MPKDRMLIKREITTYAQVLVDAAKANGNILEVAGQLKEAQEAYLQFPQLRAVSYTHLRAHET